MNSKYNQFITDLNGETWNSDLEKADSASKLKKNRKSENN